jgi:hypothetical protein
MNQGMLHRLIAVLMDVSKSLGASCDCADFERMAVLVHRVMSRQSRQFHTLGHVFGFLDGADAETALAAVFHDLVYYQVDDGLPPELEPLLSPGLRLEGREIHLAAGVAPEDRASRLCLGIFGFVEGQALPVFGGLNEYLSALAMMRLLGDHLPEAILVAVGACIEASIPFRGPDPQGRSAPERLAARLEALAGTGLYTPGPGGIEAVMRRSVAFGNHDVRDFASGDPGEFLSNTWKLLPESNASLRRSGAYSIREYRLALEKMQAFFLSLDPARIYHSWGGSPDARAMEELKGRTRRNLAWAETYLSAKLLAVGLLEAAASISGGDAPMALFMGDLPGGEEDYDSIDRHLPALSTPAWLDPDNPVYRLLRDGRLDDSSFDLRNSPLALHLYDRLEPATWGRISRSACDFFAGRLGASELLSLLPRDCLGDFISACASMVPTRRPALEAWLSSLPAPPA